MAEITTLFIIIWINALIFANMEIIEKKADVPVYEVK